MREFLPKGETFNSVYEKMLKGVSSNYKYKEYDFFSWRIWASKEINGKDLVDKQSPWPKKPTDEPN
jgi:hypothetical protein